MERIDMYLEERRIAVRAFQAGFKAGRISCIRHKTLDPATHHDFVRDRIAEWLNTVDPSDGTIYAKTNEVESLMTGG